MGPEWGQAPLHPGQWWHHQCPLLQPQPLLAVCRHRPQYQDLGKRLNPKYLLSLHTVPVFGELKCKGRWWNFQCQLYSLMIKRLFLSSNLDLSVSLCTFWMHSFVIEPLLPLCSHWFLCLWCFTHAGSGGQDYCWWAETGSHQHKQQGWTPTVYFPGMVCWWTGTTLSSVSDLSLDVWLPHNFVVVMFNPQWLYPFTYNSDVQWWQSCKYEGHYKFQYHTYYRSVKSMISVDLSLISLQTLFAGYTDNLIRVWQVTIGTR